MSCSTMPCSIIGRRSNIRYVLVPMAIVFATTSAAAQRPQVAAATESSTRSVQSSQDRGKAISLDVADSSIGYVLNEIARRAGLTVIFSNTGNELSRKTTVRFAKEPALNAIARVLESTTLTATFDSNRHTVAIRGNRGKLGPQQGAQDSAKRSIRGRVVDSVTGEPLGGVTVSIAAVNMATTTSRDGRFALNGVPQGNHTVMAKLFGYRPRSQTVTLESERMAMVNFALPASATTLSGVVTTVTGQQQKLEIGNAITSINVDSVMQVAPVSSLTDLLEHRVPGLTVVRGSGQPGDPSRLRLRGASSINNSNEMIVVVDGVRVDANPKAFGAASSGSAENSYLASSPFDLIDPNSIETIDVFKGPSAAAMYGSDAANGVLVITTKKGHSGPTSVTASATRGISYMPGKYPEGTYAYGWRQNPTYGSPLYGLCIPADRSDPCAVDRIEQYQALNDPDRTILGRGDIEQYTLTVSGGAPMAQYSFTGSSSSEIGLVKMSNYLIERYQTLRFQPMPQWMRRPDQYETLNGTGQISSQLKPNLLVRISTGASTSTQRKTALGSSAVQTFSRMAKDATVSDAQDRFYERMYRRNSAMTNSVQINWTIRDRIQSTATAGYNTTNVVDETMLPAGFEGARTDGFGTYATGRQLRQQRTINMNAEAPVWSDRIRVIAGVTYNGSDGESFQISSQKVPEGVTRPNTFDEGGSINTSSGSTRGWYVEPRLNLHSRFFVMPGFRLDNNGLSGSNAGAFLLPKLNTSWILSDEDFFPWKEQVSLLRLRVAGGVAGTQPGISDRLRLMKVAAVTGYDALEFVSLGNTRLQPERSTEFEGGIDLDVWNGRIGIVYTFYNKVRYNAIELVSTASSVALANSKFAQNVGTIKNTGHEFEFRLTPVERRELAWTTNGTVSVNTNRVTKLRAGLLPMVRSEGGSTSGQASRVVEGYPLWGVWARPLVGYTDINQNGIISADEITLADSMAYLGQPDPKGILSWSNNIRLLSGRLSLNAMLSYDWGMMQVASYMKTARSPFHTALYKLHPTLEETALIAAISKTSYPIAQTVNTVRLQSVSVNIAFPTHIAQMVRGRSLSLALQGSNLWMHSNYLGKDPNVGSLNMMNGMTEDRGLIPQPRKWQLRFQWGN